MFEVFYLMISNRKYLKIVAKFNLKFSISIEEINSSRREIFMFQAYVHRLVSTLFAYTGKNRKGKTRFPPVSKLVSRIVQLSTLSPLFKRQLWKASSKPFAVSMPLDPIVLFTRSLGPLKKPPRSNTNRFFFPFLAPSSLGHRRTPTM